MDLDIDGQEEPDALDHLPSPHPMGLPPCAERLSEGLRPSWHLIVFNSQSQPCPDDWGKKSANTATLTPADCFYNSRTCQGGMHDRFTSGKRESGGGEQGLAT